MQLQQDFCTFVIPTLGRDSLSRALESLAAQSDPAWAAIVVGDGFLPEPADIAPDEMPAGKVMYICSKKEGSAGIVRNAALPHVDAKWTAFLDDDDTVNPRYVEWLRQEQADHDVVIFRMHHPVLGILPDPVDPIIRHGQVGISFAVRTAWWDEVNFIREQHPDDPERAVNEDIRLLEALRDMGATIHVAPQIAYFVESED